MTIIFSCGRFTVTFCRSIVVRSTAAAVSRRNGRSFACLYRLIPASHSHVRQFLPSPRPHSGLPPPPIITLVLLRTAIIRRVQYANSRAPAPHIGGREGRRRRVYIHNDDGRAATKRSRDATEANTDGRQQSMRAVMQWGRGRAGSDGAAF